MKEYKVIYKETVIYTFYVTADNEDDAKYLFEEEINQGLIDFSDGEVLEAETIIKENSGR